MSLALKQKLPLVDREINVKLVSEISSCMRNHGSADGTNRLLAPDILEIR